MNRFGRLFAWLVVSTVALSLHAAPFSPAKRDAPDEIRCLARIEDVRVRLGAVPAELAEGLDANRVMALVRRRLTAAGFEVGDDPNAPQLVLNFKTLTDDAWPNVIGVVLLMDVEQQVELLRLGERMRLPTTTVVSRALSNRDRLKEVVEQRCLNAISQFINLVKQVE